MLLDLVTHGGVYLLVEESLDIYVIMSKDQLPAVYFTNLSKFSLFSYLSGSYALKT